IWTHPGKLERRAEALAHGVSPSRLAQNLELERQHAAEPRGVVGMVGEGVTGLRVEQDGEAVAVEHQPRQKRREHSVRERDLIYRPQMRSDQLVVPTPDRRIRERFGHLLA